MAAKQFDQVDHVEKSYCHTFSDIHIYYPPPL